MYIRINSDIIIPLENDPHHLSIIINNTSFYINTHTPMAQKEVSMLLFQGLMGMFLGERKMSLLERGVLREVSLFQELILGKEKVSLLERCPHFRGVLRERFSTVR